jgi:predicted HicB family RNase H-like nuclease
MYYGLLVANRVIFITNIQYEEQTMENKKQKESKERMIHVRLPENMHKKLRIRAAETDQTIQDWVYETIKQMASNKDYSLWNQIR